MARAGAPLPAPLALPRPRTRLARPSSMVEVGDETEKPASCSCLSSSLGLRSFSVAMSAIFFFAIPLRL